jgi:hypothetical protein
VAHVETSVRDDVWQRSWDDAFADSSAWEAAGCPEGYVWGVNAAAGYPGARYLPESARAAAWSRRLGHPMHEVRIETNTWTIELVFHALRVQKVEHGDPATGSMSPIEPVDLPSNAA